MQRLRLTVLFGEPSLVSGTLTVGLTALILFVANYSYLLRSGLLYDAIFGSGSPVDLIETSHSTVSAVGQTVFGNPLLNKVLFFAFWMVVGLVVYMTITSIGQTIAETQSDLKSMGYLHAQRRLIEHNLFFKLALKTVGLICWLILFWILLRFLFPFSVSATRVGLGELRSLMGWGYLIMGSGVLILSIHGLVICSRLIVARPRVFGDWDSLGVTDKRIQAGRRIRGVR